MKHVKRLFVTGTGTDIGKTYITGLIVKKLYDCGLNAAYYKAAMSGNDRTENGELIPGDAVAVKECSGIGQSLESMCPYIYENAWSPHLASRIEGNPVNMDNVVCGYNKLCEQYDYITMEGSGGILCPINYSAGDDKNNIWLEDIIKKFNMPCLIIADAGLGTINSVVLTSEYMKSRNIPVNGVIFNHYHPGDVMEEDNIIMCENMTGLRTIACVKDGDTELNIDINVLASLYE